MSELPFAFHMKLRIIRMYVRIKLIFIGEACTWSRFETETKATRDGPLFTYIPIFFLIDILEV